MHHRLLAAASAALLAVGLGACGSDSSDSSSSATTGASSSSTTASTGDAATPAGKPIVVGQICTCGGPQGGSYARSNEVAEAWAKAVNAKGGINGHPVKVVTKNDDGVPAKSLAAVKEMVEQDGIVALIGATSVQTAAFEPYVKQKGIPVVGGASTEQAFLTSPDFFASGASIATFLTGEFKAAKKAGGTKMGIMYCAEAPVCARIEGLAQASLAAVGGGLELQFLSIAASSPNYTAPCLKLKNSGTDVMTVANTSAIVRRVVADCHKQGFKPRQISGSTTAGRDWLKDPNLEGTTLVGNNANPDDNSVPGIKRFNDVLLKYAPGVRNDPNFNSNLTSVWAGATLFEAAAAKAKLTPDSTPEDLKKGLYALKDETLDGVAPPLNFTPGKPGFPTCYFIIGVQGGKFTSPQGPKSQCMTPAEATTLGKALAG